MQKPSRACSDTCGYTLCVNAVVTEQIHYLRLCWYSFLFSDFPWTSSRGEEGRKEKNRDREAARTSSNPNSCPRQLIVTAAQCYKWPKLNVLLHRKVGLPLKWHAHKAENQFEDALQDKDCYQVSVLNIETSLFEHARMFWGGVFVMGWDCFTSCVWLKYHRTKKYLSWFWPGFVLGGLWFGFDVISLWQDRKINRRNKVRFPDILWNELYCQELMRSWTPLLVLCAKYEVTASLA